MIDALLGHSGRSTRATSIAKPSLEHMRAAEPIRRLRESDGEAARHGARCSVVGGGGLAVKLETNWREFAGPSDYHPDVVEAALRSLDDVKDERSMWAAYHRVLFAVGNNHSGTLYPAALPAMTRVAEHLWSECEWVRRAAGETLVELLAFEFHPDFAPLPTHAAVAAKLSRLRPFKMAIVRARERVDSDDDAVHVFDDLLAQLDAPVKDSENGLP